MVEEGRGASSDCIEAFFFSFRGFSETHVSVWGVRRLRFGRVGSRLCVTALLAGAC